MEDNLNINLSDFDKSLLIYLDIDSIINNDSIKSKLSKEFIECLIKYKNIDATIFACYNFLDSPEIGILHNKELSECFFVKILNHIQDEKIKSLKDLIEKIKEEIDIEKISKEEYILTFILLLYIYLKENIWGPSFTFIKETEKVDYEKELFKINENYFNRLTKNDKILREEEIYKALDIFNEDIYKHSHYIIFYYLPLYFLYNINKDKDLFHLKLIEDDINKNNKYISLLLWKIRLLKLWNKLIIFPIDSLNKEIESLYEKFFIIEKSDISETIKGELLIEKSFNYIRYYNYKKCTNTIEEAKNKLKLDISLTGKYGKKTKYQTFSNPILVVDVKTNENKVQNQQKNNGSTDNVNDNINNNISLDSVRKDNPLLERPFLVDPEEEKKYSSQIITINDQIYLCALLNYLYKGLPDEDINREIILSYSEKGLKTSFDWLVFSKLLLHRSLAESKSTKKIERSLLQIETLCNQFQDREPSPYTRMQKSFIVDYPLIFSLKKLYADSYMTYGAFRTAYSIFMELYMYEDAIKCLYASNDKENAEKLANEVISKHPEPGVYCILGELKNDKDLFLKALEISNNKYPRALRCLGRYYYAVEKNFSKAKEYYEKAMSINPSFPSIWFSLGMIYISEKNFGKALVCFSKILTNDESNGEVWGNMGVCFIQLNKFKEAEKCLEQGYFKSKGSWRMLDNLVYVCIENKNLSKILFAINEYYMNEQGDKIKNLYFLVATKLYLENYKKYTEHDREYLKNKIYNLFEKYGEVDGLRPEIWDLYANFYQELELKKSNIDDLIKGFKFLIELRIKEIRTIMVKNINWEKDNKVKDVLSNITNIIRKLVENIEKIYDDNKDMKKDNDYINDKIFYVNGIENKIKKSNEEKNENNNINDNKIEPDIV